MAGTLGGGAVGDIRISITGIIPITPWIDIHIIKVNLFDLHFF
jgi:hypothetical protein